MNKSIIRVEQPDIHFDEEDLPFNPSMEVDNDQPLVNGQGNNPTHTYIFNQFRMDFQLFLWIDQPSTNGTNGTTNGDSQPKKKLTLSFEDYKSLSNTLIVYMRNEESAMEISMITFRKIVNEWCIVYYIFLFFFQVTLPVKQESKRVGWSIGTWNKL